MSGFDLLFYSPLYGTETVTYDLSLQGDYPYSNVTDFTTNIVNVNVTLPEGGVAALFTLAEDGTVSEVSVAPFATALSSGQNDFLTAVGDVSLGGQNVSSLASLMSTTTPTQYDALLANNAVLTSNVSTTDVTDFSTLLAQINAPSNAAFRQYFYNDASGALATTAPTTITFLIQYDVTRNYNYSISGAELEYPDVSGSLFYYSTANGTRYPLSTVTETLSEQVRFALRFAL